MGNDFEKRGEVGAGENYENVYYLNKKQKMIVYPGVLPFHLRL